MKKFLLLVFFLSFGSLFAQETVTLYILDGNDDAYQLWRHPSWENPTGEMFVDAEKLFVGHSFPVGQFAIMYHIGLRYLSVPIPHGSTIVSAFIQFYSYEANDDTTGIMVYCERNPNPLPFTSVEYNISDRETTYHDEFWVAAEWQAFIPGPNQRTHDIKDIVQEVVDLETWVKNNPMVFLFKGTNPAFGEIYPKAACSWEYMGDMYAPVLTVIYNEPALIEEIDAAGAMNIFPNPVLNTFTVSFTELQAGHYEICMYDLTGQQACKVHEGKLEHGDHEFSLLATELNLQPGVYFVSLRGETGNMVRKIVVKD